MAITHRKELARHAELPLGDSNWTKAGYFCRRGSVVCWPPVPPRREIASVLGPDRRPGLRDGVYLGPAGERQDTGQEADMAPTPTFTTPPPRQTSPRELI